MTAPSWVTMIGLRSFWFLQNTKETSHSVETALRVWDLDILPDENVRKDIFFLFFKKRIYFIFDLCM